MVGALTALRVGAGCTRLLAQRSVPLAGLAVRASLGGGPTVEATLREDLVALARESAELSWRELRRGIDAFDAIMRPIDPPRGDTPVRPYRVKP